MKCLKHLLVLLSLPLSCLSLNLSAAPAPVQAAQVRTQGPGFYRMMLGDLEITALLDGTHPFQADALLIDVSRQQVDSLLAQDHLSSPVDGSINAFLRPMRSSG
ncbi:hypothetical protein EC912_105290 [Luteibacter rhizovicinus]|uniref:Uncharacterized protein n=1 Tax=Luteibacter rhizovicinus TaxID=242606 RepID=A0A4V2W3V0_9GAMM|nr:hypothetical protein [Luteibacter rhizovicinus]TCV93429.1 hypothetical protein EC912_105290 [Luteibacter rhizovicinus]